METSTIEEQKVESTDDVKVVESDNNSKAEPNVSDEAKTKEPKEKSPKLDISETPEFKRAVQSATDKNLKSLQTKIAEMHESQRKLADRLEQEREAADLARKEQAELDNWGDEKPEVIKSFQDERRSFLDSKKEFAAMIAKQEKELSEANERISEAEKKASRNKAMELALKYAVPEGDKIAESINSFVESLIEAETPKEMELLARIRGAELLSKTSKNEDDIRVDSNYQSVTGDSDKEFVKKFAAGNVAITADTVKRYNKILAGYQ